MLPKVAVDLATYLPILTTYILPTEAADQPLLIYHLRHVGTSARHRACLLAPACASGSADISCPASLDKGAM